MEPQIINKFEVIGKYVADRENYAWKSNGR